MFLYRHPDEDVEWHFLAPDIGAFFDDVVLGPGYPGLVDTVLGPGVRERRRRTGRHRGQPADSWLGLLVAAGLVE
ncbi:hypothetical protein V6U90_27695 [Micromonospora sp. CPCC 206060]|uniref:hypothetical protein n=1 Tax=Micromonospora sp. CPCC 206060 TaxID=3122406 RepID=UPI002FF25A8E